MNNQTKLTQYSFTAGEIAPDLRARTDVGKYSIALSTLKNGFVRVTGGVSNRAGLEFVCEVKDSSKPGRILPFSFNKAQTYIIEAGDSYFRYIQNGGRIINNSTIVETATSFSTSELFSIKYAQSADVLTLCNQKHMPKELSRNSNIDWSISDVKIEPTISAPGNVSATKTGTSSSQTKVYRYKITAVKEDNYEESIASAASNDVTASVEAGWAVGEKITITWNAVAGATEYNVYKEVNGVYAYAGIATSTTFVDNNIDPDLTTTIPIFKNPFDPSVVPDMTENNVPSGYSVSASTESTTHKGFNAFDGKDDTYFEGTSATGTLQITLPKEKLATGVKIRTATNAPASYKFYGSNDSGATKTYFYTSTAPLVANKDYIFMVDNQNNYKTLGIEISSLVSGSVVQLSKLDFLESGNYPAAVNYFQQRRHFANTLNNPNSLFSSQTGMFNNFNVQRPLIATNAVTVKLYEGEVNEIQDIIAMNDLIALTADAEWRVNGSNKIFEATPPPTPQRQSSWGSSDLMPIVSGTMILFVTAGRNKIRDLGYNSISEAYEGDELSYLANHLFDGKQIVDWAYSKEPNTILWCVMSDGTLNALTYNPKQQILGWHQHDTDGYFESVAVVREGYEDVPYFLIRREINGQSKRYIERMKSRFVNNAVDGFFVDCGLTAQFENPVNVISGLEHLEGKKVIILADGGVIENKVVNNGSVSLGTNAGVKVTASKITVGLPYEFEMKTLNFEGENTQGSRKMLNTFKVKVDKTREDFAVVGTDGVTVQLGERSEASVNDSGYLHSGDLDCYVVAEPTTEACIHIKQSMPLPITILSVTPTIEMVA